MQATTKVCSILLSATTACLPVCTCYRRVGYSNIPSPQAGSSPGLPRLLSATCAPAGRTGINVNVHWTGTGFSACMLLETLIGIRTHAGRTGTDVQSCQVWQRQQCLSCPDLSALLPDGDQLQGLMVPSAPVTIHVCLHVCLAVTDGIATGTASPHKQVAYQNF